LNKAAGQANDRDIKYLVNCGSKIDDRKSIFGEAPIHKVVLSSEEQKPATLKTIIEECQANVNNIDSNGWSALHHAASIGDIQSASMLIEANAKVNAFSNQNRTPLHLAAANNHVELCELLLMNNAELEQKDDLECTPLHLACKKGSYECMVLLLENGANIYAQDHRLWNPLHYASYNGHADVVNKLVRFEADNDVLKEMRSS
jgi:ankyrin repeat protein